MTFELAGLDAPPPPNDTPMWAAGVPVTGRSLNLQTCPPTLDDLRAAHIAARVRWENAGPDSYEFVIDWRPLQPASTTYRVTVIDGETTSVVPEHVGGEAPPPPVAQPTLDAVPATVDEVFQLLDAAITDEQLRVAYHEQLGYPHEFTSSTVSMSIWELRPFPS